MQLALEHLGRAAAGPDRLADAADRLAVGGVLVDELAPGRDDLRRVAAEGCHVDELDALGVVAELETQALDLGGDHRDHDRLAGLEPLADERDRAGHELVVAAVEESLVAIAVVRLLRRLISLEQRHDVLRGPGEVAMAPKGNPASPGLTASMGIRVATTSYDGRPAALPCSSNRVRGRQGAPGATLSVG